MSNKYVKGVDEVPRRLHDIEQRLKEFMPSVAKTVTAQVQQQMKIVNTLAEVSESHYAEFTTAQTGFTGFRTAATVTLTSSTGHIEISYGGSLDAGEGYFCYAVKQGSTTIVSRESVQSNPAKRVAVSGGASFAPSGYGHTVIDIPANTSTTVTLELYTSTTFCYFLGGSLLAKVSL